MSSVYDVTHLAYKHLVVVLMSVLAQSFCCMGHSVLLVIHAVLTSNAKSTKNTTLKKPHNVLYYPEEWFILQHHHNLGLIFLILQ